MTVPFQSKFVGPWVPVDADMVGREYPSSPSLLKSAGGRIAVRSLPEESKANRRPPSPAISQGTFGMSGQKIGKFSEARWDRAVAYLRALHPLKTADAVAADTGIKADTVRKMLAGVCEPTFRNFTRLLFAYGPEFAACVYPSAPAWLSAAGRAEHQSKLTADLTRVQREIADLLAAR